MVLLLLVGCQEYDLKGDPYPDIVVSPAAILAEAICSSVSETVLVSNVGTGVLEVSSIRVAGDGGSVADPGLPLRIEPGARAPISVIAVPGAATLIIESDDPDEPVVEVTLEASDNQNPVATILAPWEDQVIPAEADLTLTALVSDGDGALADLSLEWVSSVAGHVATAIADGDGRVETIWAPAARVPGPQTLSLIATDRCVDVGEATIFFCQDGPFSIDVLTEEAWHTEGSASWDGAELTLTGPEEDAVGAAFDLVSLFDGDDLEVDLSFQVGGGTGGEGFSMTLLDANRRVGFIGGGGCGLGYGGGPACTDGPALPGWSVEVDTHPDAGDCADGPHLAFTFDGAVDDYAACADIPAVDDGAWHILSVRVLAPRVTMTLDGVIVLDAEVEGLTAFQGYVGFTASTTTLTDAHRIRDVRVTDRHCVSSR